MFSDSLRHDCCSSDASSDANEEKFDSDASLDADEETLLMTVCLVSFCILTWLMMILMNLKKRDQYAKSRNSRPSTELG